MDRMRLSQLHRTFLQDLAARGGRPRTIQAYASHFALFSRFLGEDDLRAFREDTLLEYPTWLASWRGPHTRGQGCTPNTIHAHLASLRSFAAWLVRRGDLKRNPTEKLPGVRRPRRLHRSVPVEWLDRIIAADLSARDRALLLVAQTCGLRRQELVNLNLEDLDLEHQALVVRDGKGGDERALPLAPATIAAIEVWLGERGREPGPLFTGCRGMRLGQQGVGGVLSAAARKAGLPHITPHQLRHTWATQAVNEGVPVHVVQAALGHASLETTARYLHVTSHDMRAAFARLHRGTLIEQPSTK